MPDRDGLPDYEVRADTLSIDTTLVEFEYPIAEVVPHSGLYIVRLEYMDLPQSLENQNVIACTPDGDRDWQIEESPASDDHGNPFVGLTVKDIGLVGYTCRGLSVIIDTDTRGWEMHKFNK